MYYLEINFNYNSLCSKNNSILPGIFVIDLIKRSGRIVAMIKIISTAISTDVIIYRREHL